MTKRARPTAMQYKKGHVMPRFMIRARYSQESFKGLISEPGNRRVESAKIYAEVGAKLIDFYFDLSASESIAIVDAELEQLRVLKIYGMASGAFLESVQSELITAEELENLSQAAGTVGSGYSPPNRDEIDRMLLEE